MSEKSESADAQAADKASPDNQTERKLAEYEKKIAELSQKLNELDSQRRTDALKQAFKNLLYGYNLESKFDILFNLVPKGALTLDGSGNIAESEKIITMLRERLPELFTGVSQTRINPTLSRSPSQPRLPSAPKTLSFDEVRRLAAQKYRELKNKQ
ncbi:MAG: hypothetical protein Kow0090_10300 [Myxococcota bacterium]